MFVFERSFSPLGRKRAAVTHTIFGGTRGFFFPRVRLAPASQVDDLTHCPAPPYDPRTRQRSVTRKRKRESKVVGEYGRSIIPQAAF